jgi:hypothetical protein
MAATPPATLVLDISALSAATPREWLEFNRVGSCIVPQAVYEEMKFLFDRSPDPDLERIARAFNHFYATSGWQISDAHAHHALLKSNANHSLTKRARISLAVGRCAYSFAQENSLGLVVLVSSDRDMLQRIYDIQAPNLCAITGQSLLQWSRTGQRPVAVSQKLQQLRSANGLPPNSTITSVTAGTSTSSVRTTSPSRTSTSTTHQRKSAIHKAAPIDDTLKQVISLLLSAAALACAGWLAWWILYQNGIRTNNQQTSYLELRDQAEVRDSSP